MEGHRSNLFAFRSFRSGLCFGLRGVLFVARLRGFLGTRRCNGHVALSDSFDSSGHRVIGGRSVRRGGDQDALRHLLRECSFILHNKGFYTRGKHAHDMVGCQGDKVTRGAI